MLMTIRSHVNLTLHFGFTIAYRGVYNEKTGLLFMNRPTMKQWNFRKTRVVKYFVVINDDTLRTAF